MPDQSVTLRLPGGFDRLINQHFRPAAGVNDDVLIDDNIRRAYIVSILAAVVDALHAPVIADALVRLNGGFILRDDTEPFN